MRATLFDVWPNPPAQATQVESDADMAKQVLAWMTRTGSLSTTWGDMAALSQSAAEPVAQHPDDAAVDAFAMAMKAKLAEARAKGRGGWQDKADCPQQRLSDMLHAHVAKGDPRDVANFCMFLHQRGESILPAEPVAQVDQVGELLAIIHGDGGHYRAEHGLQKAAKDAQEKVIQMMTKIATSEPVAQPADSGRVPEGWMLVPREPTTAILEALESTQQNTEAGSLYNSVDCWEAMLAAAPQPGEPS
jgi:hypothetical protein